jgi:hypothetical protein
VVRFRRPAGILPLLVLERGGSIETTSAPSGFVQPRAFGRKAIACLNASRPNKCVIKRCKRWN